MPISPSSFTFGERDNFTVTSIHYAENFINLSLFHGGFRTQRVVIPYINLWIPNGSYLQSQSLDQRIPYLSVAFATMIDAVREEVGNEWVNGKLNSLEQRFKQEIRAVIEMGFPGAIIDFKPQLPTWPRSTVIHNIL